MIDRLNESIGEVVVHERDGWDFFLVSFGVGKLYYLTVGSYGVQRNGMCGILAWRLETMTQYNERMAFVFDGKSCEPFNIL